MADLSQQIEDAASAPKDATSGGKRVTQHSLSDLVKADEYLAEKVARTRSTLPVRIAKFKLGGST